MSEDPSSQEIMIDGRFPILGIVAFLLAGVAIIGFFFPLTTIGSTIIDTFVSYRLVHWVRNGDYVAGRFIAVGTFVIAYITTVALRTEVRVTNEVIEYWKGRRQFQIEWSRLASVKTTRSSLRLTATDQDQTINEFYFSGGQLHRILHAIIDRAQIVRPSLQIIDEGCWLAQDETRQHRWYMRVLQSTTATMMGFLGVLALFLAISYYGCWVKPSGVTSQISFTVSDVIKPPDYGWWENQGLYGSFDRADVKALKIINLSGDLDSTNIGIIVYFPNIWNLRTGDRCTANVAKSALFASSFVPKAGYYVHNIINQADSNGQDRLKASR